MSGLRAAAWEIGPFLEEHLDPADGPGPPTVRRGRVADVLDDSGRGHVLAAGVDSRYLEVDVWWDADAPPQPIAASLLTAGEAAEEFGVSLARWSQDMSFGAPGRPGTD